MIWRLAPRDDPSERGGSGTTTAQAAAINPDAYKLINGYYYTFHHDQAACSSNINSESGHSSNNANDTIKALLPKLEAAK